MLINELCSHVPINNFEIEMFDHNIALARLGSGIFFQRILIKV